MSARDRLLSEQTFHDEQARMRAKDLASLAFDDDFFLDHETWIRSAFEALGPLPGQKILDYGCGHGMAAVVLRGAGPLSRASICRPVISKKHAAGPSPTV